jgi:hypothetical protein
MNEINPDGKLIFFKAAKVMGLDDATRDRGWRMVTDLGLSPDDPVAIVLVFTVLLGNATTVVPKALNALPSRIAKATSQASGQIANTLSTNLLKNDFAKKMGRAVARSAAAYFHTAQMLHRLRVSSVIVLATVAVIFVSFHLGMYLGWVDAESVANHWTVLGDAPDGATWLHLAQMNRNLTAALAACDAPGSNGFLINGARACNMPLWLEDPIPKAITFGYGARLQSFVTSASWAEIYFALVGFSLGTLGRKLVKATFSWRPIRWLFDAE